MPKHASKTEKPAVSDQRPDAWERFERAVDAALRTPAGHKLPITKSKKQTAAKRDIHEGKART